MNGQQTCEACLDVAEDTILAGDPFLTLDEAHDAAVEARSNYDYPCSDHA